MRTTTTATVIGGAFFAYLACACATKGEDDNVSGAADASRADASGDSAAASQADGGQQDTGTSTTSDAQTGSDSQGPGTCNPVTLFSSVNLPDCDTCLTQNCCELVQACVIVPDCKALSDCGIACASSSDPTMCNNTCSVMHQPSVSKGNAWINCMKAKCVGTCTP